MDNPPADTATPAAPPTTDTATPAVPTIDLGSTAAPPKSSLSRFEKLSVILQFVSLLTLATYTVLSYQQFSIMRLQLDAMAAVPVVTGFAPYPLTDGKLKAISFEIENPRATPARVMGGKMKILKRPATEPHPDIDTVDGAIPVVIDGYVINQHPLHVNIDFHGTEELRAEEFQHIQADTLRLYFVGQLQYDDGFGRRLLLSFCKVYLMGLEWQGCPVDLPASR